MKPKKRILYLCGDEWQMSRRAFVLETKPFGVLRARSAAEAAAILEREQMDSVHLLLAEIPMPELDGVIETARAMHPELRVLLMGDVAHLGDHDADAWLPGSVSMAEMVERIKVLVGRKRGPKGLRSVPDASRGKPALSIAAAAAEHAEVA